MPEPAASATRRVPLADTVPALIALLADGEFHSGESLGAALGVTRAAVWKKLQALDDFGLTAVALPGTGYRLARALDLFELPAVRDACARAAPAHPADIELVAVTGSTNADLMAVADQARSRPRVLLAEFQRAGRGRRGRDWVSPFAGGIMFSLLRRFDLAPSELAALSLVAGVCLRDALVAAGVPGLALKWPNDIVTAGEGGRLRKLGGVLVEVRSEAQGPCSVVIGVGLNYVLGASPGVIDQPWTDLGALRELPPGSRSRLAGELMAALAGGCAALESDGATDYLERWAQCDALRGRAVTVEQGGVVREGVADGIDAQGALRVICGDECLHVQSGEVSVRA